jgi:hydroxymethylbilane synthase
MGNHRKADLLSIRIGTRGSPLALWQAHHVRDHLVAATPGLEVTIDIIRTAGEKFPEKSAGEIGVGIFTGEIDRKLLSRDIDLAVHSMKDVPSELTPGLAIACVPPRESPLEAFVGAGGTTWASLDDLPRGARVGTGSPRRQAQLLHRRPDLQVVPLRGNVDTRLRKVREQNLAGTILAHAGLRRLGRESVIHFLIPGDRLIPAVGQGAIAVSAREDREDLLELVRSLEHSDSRARITAERSFLKRLRGGCQVPAGALAEISRGTGQPGLRIQGALAMPDGSLCIQGECSGPAEEAEELGLRLADDLRGRGGGRILEAIRS